MTTQQTQYRKTMLQLPTEVHSAFETLGADTEIRNEYARALRGAGWTLQSISDAANITRERVRQIVNAQNDAPQFDNTGALIRSTAPAIVATLPLPEPPKHAAKLPRTFVEPDPVKLARLLELKPFAQQVRSNGGKHRAEAEEYTNLIAEVHLQDGVTLYRLAKRLEVTHGALRFRLARYGLKAPANGGSSKVYTQILPENRAI